MLCRLKKCTSKEWLYILIGEHRKWRGGTGANIPSFEIFTSPDWRGTNGTISFNQPLYYSGKRVSGISLTFKDGIVTEATATENEATLKEMIAQENANKIGEFSLTDKRHSRITHFMAETLYDENMGGEFGNTHIALGAAYEDTFDGDTAKPTTEEWAAMGFNNCPKVHTRHHQHNRPNRHRHLQKWRTKNHLPKRTVSIGVGFKKTVIKIPGFSPGNYINHVHHFFTFSLPYNLDLTLARAQGRVGEIKK